MYLFPRAAITRHQKLDGLPQMTFSVSQFWRLMVVSQGGSGATLSLCDTCWGESFLASLLAFGGLPTIFGVPRLMVVITVILSLLSHGILPVCLHLCISSFPIRTPVIWNQGPTLHQYDVILTNYIRNNPVSK